MTAATGFSHCQDTGHGTRRQNIRGERITEREKHFQKKFTYVSTAPFALKLEHRVRERVRGFLVFDSFACDQN